MGSEPVDTGFSSHNLNYTKVFEEIFPHLLTVGMTYEQFWYKDPHIVKHYLKAMEIEASRRNTDAWLQGYYTYKAIESYVEILPAFPKKGAKVHPYLEAPILLTEAEMERKKEEEKRIKHEQMKQKMLLRTLEINSRKGG